MMSIILELQSEAIKNNVDILNLLRKSLLIARKLCLSDFEDWIKKELNGYEKSMVPSYREVKGKLKGFNPYRGWIPVLIPDEELEKAISIKQIPYSIAYLNSLLQNSENNIIITFSGEQNAMFSKLTGHLSEFRLEVSTAMIYNILEQVKNKILEWSLLLEEKGIVGHNISFTNSEKEIANNEPQIINYITNIYGNVNDTQLQQGSNSSTQNK